ncbi:MAG: TIGR02757 family protein [Deltaproteobacteria bacterium]|nr:TIGR02757 family protein [Deltaproteobacteria bacterium]
MNRREVQVFLDDLVARFHHVRHRHHDPVDLVHRFERPADIEVAAFIASALAYGRAAQVRASVSRVFDALGPDLHGALIDFDPRHSPLPANFVHRFTTRDDMNEFLTRTADLLRKHGSLRAAFREGDCGGEPIDAAMSRFVAQFRAGGAVRPNVRYLLPDPADGSACKRFSLFLRWMVRDADGIDFGLWSEFGASRLVMPLDTHVARISRRLGLLRRASDDRRAAIEVTDALRSFAPDDPLRYDFAITHIGITGQWKDLIP